MRIRPSIERHKRVKVALGVASVAAIASTTSIVLTLTSAVPDDTSVITYDYTPGDIEDAVSNALAAVSGGAVTNAVVTTFSFTDDFDQASGTHIRDDANWTSVSTTPNFDIETDGSGNAVASVALADGQEEMRYADPGTDMNETDVFIETTVQVPPQPTTSRDALRLRIGWDGTAFNYLWAQIVCDSSGNYFVQNLWRHGSSGGAQIRTDVAIDTPVAGDVFRLELASNGLDATVYFKGVEVDSFTMTAGLDTTNTPSFGFRKFNSPTTSTAMSLQSVTCGNLS